MIDFFCRQEKTFGLGNFINCTPTLKALAYYYKEPIPVLFETIGEAFEDCKFIKHIKKPKGKELFGSYTINSQMPDWEFIYKEVQLKLRINLPCIPYSYVDAVEKHVSIENSYYVIVRGCFSNIPHKVSSKDPGDNIYINIIRDLEHRTSIKAVFVGTKDDYNRAKLTFDIIGRRLKWGETTLRDALSLVNSAKFVIGNDTGLVHAAAALNKDTFCMWKKTDKIKNRARGEVCYSYSNHFENFRKWISGLI